MGRRRLADLYTLLAVVGGIVPYAIFLPWLGRHGPDAPLFARSLFATGPAAIFSIDALLSSLIFLLFVAVEGRRRRMTGLWLYPLLICGFGLCCALPAFLAARERRGR